MLLIEYFIISFPKYLYPFIFFLFKFPDFSHSHFSSISHPPRSSLTFTRPLPPAIHSRHSLGHAATLSSSIRSRRCLSLSLSSSFCPLSSPLCYFLLLHARQVHFCCREQEKKRGREGKHIQEGKWRKYEQETVTRNRGRNGGENREGNEE